MIDFLDCISFGLLSGCFYSLLEVHNDKLRDRHAENQ